MDTSVIAKKISEMFDVRILRITVENAITELGLRMHPVHCEVVDGYFHYDDIAFEKILRKIKGRIKND